MSGSISLCSFCRFIPLNVDILEQLRKETRPRSKLGSSRPVLLDRSRKTELAVGGRVVFALGKAERVLSSDCPFCKITAIAVRDIKRTTGWHALKADTPLQLTWSHEGPSSKGVFRVNDRDDIYICFVEENCNGPSKENLLTSTACMIRPAPAHLEPSKITKWIAECERLHGPECNVHIGITGPIRDFYRGLELMRFVDVQKKCIVELRKVVKYVALSYVWGAAATLRLTTMNQQRMRTPGILWGLELPNTIWDAIDLTRACGERYLWVDALCIVQNDAEDLEAGTYAMDLIYEMSVFTMVAASGYDAGYGLPGFRVGTRLAPPYVEVAPGIRLGVLPEVDTLLGDSCYATRGWTLQEEMLSKRKLYFVDDRIFFHCPRMTLSEDCAVSLRRLPYNLLRMLEPFRNYKQLVRDYSCRVLTRQNDAFHAMSGIIRRISENQRWNIISGMPTLALENMMLFRRKFHPLSRRFDFPSYSWLGWKGELEFMEGVYFFDGWIKWYVRDPATGEIFPIERRPTSPKFDMQVRGIVATDDIATQKQPDFGLLPGVQMNLGVPSERTAMLHPRPTFSLLLFSTLAVFFQLGSVDYVKGKASIINPGKCDSGNANGYLVGTVTLDGLDEYPAPRDAEFILLSKTIPSNDDLESLEISSRKEMYAVMLIEWVHGVAERRGIGFIDAIEFKDSMAPGPVWKEIVLG